MNSSLSKTVRRNFVVDHEVGEKDYGRLGGSLYIVNGNCNDYSVLQPLRPGVGHMDEYGNTCYTYECQVCGRPSEQSVLEIACRRRTFPGCGEVNVGNLGDKGKPKRKALGINLESLKRKILRVATLDAPRRNLSRLFPHKSTPDLPTL